MIRRENELKMINARIMGFPVIDFSSKQRAILLFASRSRRGKRNEIND